MKKVSIIGMGYIGLPTALLAARSGLKVTGIENNKEKIKALNSCQIADLEPEILEQLHQVCATEYFYITDQYQSSDYFVVAVPTPVTESKKPNLSCISDVAMKIAEVIKKGDTLILESTVPIGATQSFADVIANESGLTAGKDFYVAHCPERVLPGNIFQELKVNDRVIGGINQISSQKAAEFYKYFVSGDLYLTNLATAEMVKLIENSYRDVNLAFAQQIATISEKIELNPFEVIQLANKHPRVSILQPSCGIGGHCIAVDPYFLIDSFKKDTQLLQAARLVNDNRSLHVISKIERAALSFYEVHNKKCTVLLLGLTYKPDVDDIRESAALLIAEKLSENKMIHLLICDPHIEKKVLSESLKSRVVDLNQGIERADVIGCLVAHSKFRAIDKKKINKKKIIDICGLFFELKLDSRDQEQFFWPASNSVEPDTKNVISSLRSTKEEQI